MIKTKKKLKELIGKDELEKVIENLMSCVEDENVKDMVVLQFSKLNDLKKQTILGTIDFDSNNLIKSRIRNSLIEIINSLEENQISHSSQKKGNRNHIEQNHFGKGDNIGGNKIINNNEAKPFWKR